LLAGVAGFVDWLVASVASEAEGLHPPQTMAHTPTKRAQTSGQGARQ